MLLWLQNLGNGGGETLFVPPNPEQDYIDENEPNLILEDDDCAMRADVYIFVDPCILRAECISLNAESGAEEDFIVGEAPVGKT